MGNSETSIKEEELSIQIYEIVHTNYPEYSEKITGMILESDSEELRTLLQNNKEELSKRIKMAATVVRQNCDNKLPPENSKKNNIPDSFDDIDSIGNKLYGIVHQQYPVFAGNVTGMLLEMDINRLKNLLNDNVELMECIHQAAHVYMESQTEEKKKFSTHNITSQTSLSKSKTDVNITQKAKIEQEDKQTLGEQIYLKIVAVYPEKAAKLTGMFLEMDIKSLEETLANSELFKTKLSEALDVLHFSTAVETDDINGVSHDTSKIEKNRINSSNNIDTSSNKEERTDLERQDLAEQLYLKVESKYPQQASKITGMLLEMDLHSLRELNKNSELFNKKLNETLQVLSEFALENEN